MFRTRRLLAPSSGYGSLSGGSPRLLLPESSFLETVQTAFAGAWSQVFDQASRDLYEELTRKKIIKDDVLQNARNGSTLTFSLFQNLQNPLWKQYFGKEHLTDFVEGAGPALEQFHDTLAKLRNQLTENIDAEKKTLNEKMQQSDEEILAQNHSSSQDLTKTLLGENEWLQTAEKDSRSLAGRLFRMSTPVCMEAFYYTSKIDLLGRPFGKSLYEDDSCRVNEVALLNARVMEMNDPSTLHDDDDDEHEEFRASSETQRPVAAQIDVLYEISHVYSQTLDPIIAELQKGSSESSDGGENTVAENNADNQEATNHDAPPPSKMERVRYTNLVVAAFEGWLHGGPDPTLRWRVGMLREAIEFPYVPPTITKLSS